jgi:predicted CXXCH cytochrome family protein
MTSIARIRTVSVVVVATGLLAAGVLGVACNPLPHDGEAVTRGECVSCHRAEYEAAKQPLHVDVLPTTCAECHQETAWTPATFDHGSTTAACVSCHLDDYENKSATDPLHAMFEKDCVKCHDTTAWRPASFAHPWPLVGEHQSAFCSDCHAPPVYDQASTECVSCHGDDYARAPANDPRHTGLERCGNTCHHADDSSWSGVHAAWPLTGKHDTLEATCAACHGEPPTYAGTSKACVACHGDDFQRAKTQIPTHTTDDSCAVCHTTNDWSAAHPENVFPIKTGKHTKYGCTDCHNASLGSSKVNADCVGCHDEGAHSLTKMADQHREEGDYKPRAGQPSFCLDCHPDGRHE